MPAKLKDLKDGLGIFNGEYIPTPSIVKHLYTEGELFNNEINLYEQIEANVNFTVANKQWERLNYSGVPAIQVNFLNQIVNHSVAIVTSNDIAIQASALRNVPSLEQTASPITILSNELQSLNKLNKVQKLIREMAFNAAIKGDHDWYTYWDEEDKIPRTMSVDNDKVIFGDPNSRDVQSQPYIIITEFDLTRNVKHEAKENGQKDWKYIASNCTVDKSSNVRVYADKTQTFLIMWKEWDGKVWAYKCTDTNTIVDPWCLEVERYPIVHFSWGEVDNNYHGSSLVSGLIPSQIAVNKCLSLAQLCITKNAFPVVAYDATRVGRWTDAVGAAIPVKGGDITGIAKVIEPAQMNPQVFQVVNTMLEETKRANGLTAAATGEAAS